jgi:hypothetical protein
MVLISNELLANSKASSLPSLDKDGHNRNKEKCSCGTMTLIGAKKAEGKETWTHLRVYCKKWTCPKCGPKKASKLRKSIIKKASEKDLRRLLTLTLDPSKCKAEESIPYIKNCWNKMRTYLKRKFGKNISFIAVLELQKNGYAHLHIMVDRYIEQAWVSGAWESIGGGRIVHIKHVDIHRVTHYLSKYLTKSMFLEHYGKNRRYTTSRDLTLKEAAKEKVEAFWRVLRFPIESLLRLAGLDALHEEKDFHNNLRSFETDFYLLDEFPVLEDFLLR